MITKKKNILFIINPIAGVRSKKNIPALLEQFLDQSSLEYKYLYTECAGHGTEIAKKAAENGVDIVVAVGGDGTINEVAKGLIGTSTALGIIPMGSGNGLARHLGIPLKTNKAIALQNSALPKKIDVGYMNDHLFLCTAGVGFDAEVAHEFDVVEGRGLITYTKCVLRKFKNYKEEEFYYKSAEGLQRNPKAFSITFANASQYGNGIFISPASDISDGLLEACTLKPVRWWAMPLLWLRMRSKSIESSVLFEKVSSQSFILKRKGKGYVHLDGEPLEMGSELKIALKKHGLKVMIKSS